MEEMQRQSPPTRVVWIEISVSVLLSTVTFSHHPHGWCGLKSTTLYEQIITKLSPPTRVVWIEINAYRLKTGMAESPPTRVVWIEMLILSHLTLYLISHHPHGWCGLKLCKQTRIYDKVASPPTRVVWIEIYRYWCWADDF